LTIIDDRRRILCGHRAAQGIGAHVGGRLFAQLSAIPAIRYDTICSWSPRQRCFIRSSATMIP